MRYAVMTFGRFQPPTKAHEKMFNQVLHRAYLLNGVPFVFCSTTQDPKRNPLPYETKVQMLHIIAPHCRIVPIKDPNLALRFLSRQGYEVVTMVAGNDRLLKYYDFEEYLDHPDPEKRINLKKIFFASSGERDEDGVSATKMRQLAISGDYEGFKTLAPSTFKEENVKQLYMDVRNGLCVT